MAVALCGWYTFTLSPEKKKKKKKHFRNNQHRHSTGKFGHFPFFFETNPDVLDTQHPLVNHHFPIGFLGVSMSIPIAGWFMENPKGKALWSMIFPYCSMVFPYVSWQLGFPPWQNDCRLFSHKLPDSSRPVGTSAAGELQICSGDGHPRWKERNSRKCPDLLKDICWWGYLSTIHDGSYHCSKTYGFPWLWEPMLREYGGFHSHGGIPIAGWLGKIPSINGWWLGVPPLMETPIYS